MSFSSRHRTLLSIYGNANDDGDRLPKKHVQKPVNRGIEPSRPSRPSKIAPTRPPNPRHDAHKNMDAKVIKLVSVVDTKEENVRSTSECIESASSEDAVPTGDCECERTDGVEKQASPRSTDLRARKYRSSYECDGKAVLALYGDGFLEIPPPSDGRTILTDAFTIRMHIFKAADMQSDSDKVDVNAPRHQNPELDDAGEFVRWTCCGSTDRNVHGCTVSKRGENSGSFSLPETSAPKLLFEKLLGSNETEGIYISIYDRHQLSSKLAPDQSALGGCRVWWNGYECWAKNYDVPSSRWVQFSVVFDCRYLRIYIDTCLVDCVSVYRHAEMPIFLRRGSTRKVVTSSSIYVGGRPSHSRRICEWRSRNGFVGLISSLCIWKTANDCVTGLCGVNRRFGNYSTIRNSEPNEQNCNGHEFKVLRVGCPDARQIKDYSTYNHTVNIHRNVFWRKEYPPFVKSISPASNVSFVLLDNFYDRGYHDIGSNHAKLFDNLLLSIIQNGDIRVIIQYALDLDMELGNEHGCRNNKEYEQKSAAVIRSIEQMSPLLTVSVNDERDSIARPCIGSFEIFFQLTRAAGRSPVTITLHSMTATSCFPNEGEIKRKIEWIVLHEAKRCPGEEIYAQAFRNFLALAARSKQNRERMLLEAVVNRKIVITERKLESIFEKIGFFFCPAELQEVTRYFRNIQDNYFRNQNRVEDLLSLSMLTPTEYGMYTLPPINGVTISSTLSCDGNAMSPWRFICVMLDYDFQLLEFVHDDCPQSQDGNISYQQTRYLHGGFVDRVNFRLSSLRNRVYCILLSMQRIGADQRDAEMLSGSRSSIQRPERATRARVQMENAESHHLLGKFDVMPTNNCRWLTLAVLYRGNRLSSWRLQALGWCGEANSIHASVEEIHDILADYHILQRYKVVVRYVVEDGRKSLNQYEEYARRFSKNITFGRNGQIVTLPMSKNKSKNTTKGMELLRISLKLQGSENEIEVYRHESYHQPIPAIQFIYRTILRVLYEHGIKESLQQNPFAAEEGKTKRRVDIRVVSEQTNKPVENAHVFIEKKVDQSSLTTDLLAKKIVPTLTMGSKLVSIRRRLQNKRALEEIREVAQEFVSEVIKMGTRIALTSLRRDSKLVPYMRSKAMLKKTMRRRYERIKNHILEQVKESERGRIYSRNAPFRLQQMFRSRLHLSNSERDLMQDLSTQGVKALHDDDFQLTTEANQVDPESVYEVWQSHKMNYDNNLHPTEDNPSKTRITTPQLGEEIHKNIAQNDDEDSPVRDDQCPDQGAWRKRKSHSNFFISDSSGRVSCSLTPGSYSLYIFHLEYFEWTSLIVVFPSVNTSGFYGSTPSASSTVQEMLIPLEVFRWSYSIQLVDFYHQHMMKMVAGIPLQIVDKCSSQRCVVTTNNTGRATWDVRKGIYTISALKECSCILYSASKNVVVDGGRYRPSRMIHIPVLIGKVKIQVRVGNAIPAINTRDPSIRVNIRVISDPQVEASCRSKLETDPTTCTDAQTLLGSLCHFNLRLGTYRLEATASGFFTCRTAINVTWNSMPTESLYLIVMSPLLTHVQTYRVIFSYMSATPCMDAIVEAVKDKDIVAQVWRQNPEPYKDNVILEGITTVDECEYQSYLIKCHTGVGYRCLVASTIHQSHVVNSMKPSVQIYSSAGLVYKSNEWSGAQCSSCFYWHVCSWNESGDFLPIAPTQAPTGGHDHETTIQATNYLDAMDD